jgi:hypothetical protein
VSLSNKHLRLSLDSEDGYALTGLAATTHAVEFLAGRPARVEQDRSPWLIWVRDASGQQVQLTSADAAAADHKVAAERLTVTWTGVRSAVGRTDLAVTMTVRLPADSAKSYWDIEVKGRATGALWQVDFPRVFGIRSLGDDQMCVPQYWGRLIRDPTRNPVRYSVNYPQPASMQFLAYWGTEDQREPELPKVDRGVVETGWAPDRSDAVGLYWATEDANGYLKRFAVDSQTAPGQLAWHIEHIPGLPTWPLPAHREPQPVSYSPDYDTVIAPFTGDYHEAAALYRDWAKKQVWCQRGTADEWPDAAPPDGSDALARWTPKWFREVGFWAKSYHEPAKVLPEWAAYRKWLRVPMASHYYRYNIAKFDDNYPEHLPPDPYLLQGVRDARAMGVRPLPYINGVIWDTDTQSWIKENGFAAAAKAESGGIYPWDINGEIHASMCPATEQWRAKMRETSEKLIWEHGMCGVYLDCLAATQALPCYDPAHGHPIRGGDYPAKGNRRLMLDLRKHIRRFDREACFFTEEIGEQYLDVMDGYLTLDITRSYCRPGEQVFPVFTAAYHPYTINFGSDADIDLDPDFFAWQFGEAFVWGEQPLISAAVAKTPTEGDPNSEFLREVTQAYYRVGQRFLQGGQWRRIAVRPAGVKPGKCGLELAAKAHTLEYSKLKDRYTTWSGPAVMASAWEQGGDLAVVMVNITGEEQTAELTVRADRLNVAPQTRLVRAWPLPAADIGEADGAHKLTVPARSVAIYVLTADVARASRARPLDETPWELLTVEGGAYLPVLDPRRSLFACADGTVENVVRADSTVARPLQFSDTGEVKPRHGKQPQVRGPAAEGHGLPRSRSDQPFLLLHRLPHAVQTATGDPVRVAAGGDDYLDCQVGGGTTLTFAGKGFVVVHNCAKGELVRGLDDGLASSVSVPAQGTYLVGYARLDPDALTRNLAEVPVLEARCRPLIAKCRALATAPKGRRAQALADATRVLCGLEQSLNDLPAALSPASPLMEVHHQLQSLLNAQAAACIEIRADDDWVSPGVPKDLRLVVTGCGDLAGRVGAVDLVPVGNWTPGAAAVALGKQTAGPDGALLYGGRLTLNAGNYVERMVPVVASVRVTRAGLDFYLTDILRLEANRPFEFQTQSTPVTVVAGRVGTGEATLRNWSPYEVEVTTKATGPEGWRLTPEPAKVSAPALKDTALRVQIAPPASAQRGEYEVRCLSDYASGLGTAVIGLFKISVLESLVPFVAQADRWEQPKPDNLACLRQRGKLALFAKAGERLRLKVSNIRVTQYTDSLRVRLLDPDLKVIVDDSIPVDGGREINQPAPQTGTYYLELTPGAGSTKVEVSNRCAAEIATKEDPLRLYCSRIQRWFFVPADSKGFRFGAVDGGPDETAHFEIASPAGRAALDANGNFGGTEVGIEVRPGEAGKVWTLLCEPRQDVHFWLDGDVCPYLSTSLERVLVGQ